MEWFRSGHAHGVVGSLKVGTMSDERQFRRWAPSWGVARRMLSVLGAAGLVAGLSASLYYASQLLATFRGSLSVPSARHFAPGAPMRFVELRAGRRDTVVLALTIRPALLLVYSSSCGVCSDNMPRWLDLVQELRRSGSAASVYAIDLDGRDSLGTYWPRVAGVRLLTPLDRDAFIKRTGVPGTPTAVVTRAGALDAITVGILGPRRRAYLISRLKA